MGRIDSAAALRHAEQLYYARNLDEAERICADVVRAEKRNVNALYMLGSIALDRVRLREASTAFERALKIKPTDARLLERLAHTRLAQGRPDEAMRLLEKALRARPGYPDALASKAELLRVKGDDERAWGLIEPHLKGPAMDPLILIEAVTLLTRLGRGDEAVELAGARLDDDRLPPIYRRRLFFAAGRAHDRAGRLDKAFELFAKGNELAPAAFDAARHRAMHEHMAAYFSRARLSSLATSTLASTVPIFIVGMPRCGSTLIERILDAHPSVHGAGELPALPQLASSIQIRLGAAAGFPDCLDRLTAAEADRIANDYLAELRAHARHAPRVVDKMLINYLYLGLIQVLFPGARVIHCRRNLLDLGLSCYMNLNPRLQSWARNLAEIGVACRAYEGLMRHWSEVLDVGVFDLAYESLIAEPERWIRELIEFCGLPWDDRCLEHHASKRPILTHSYDQANRPIYDAAVGRAEKYAPFLEPLRRALHAT